MSLFYRLTNIMSNEKIGMISIVKMGPISIFQVLVSKFLGRRI